ncbi:hypothetical protein CHLRE_07g325650v5 [Chlamydomonas reinhardtii]|uniref:Uncharacterized protein n=1 Tax=Chlamydomonas reinhardtii TaxID=3055 RepID=A8I7Q7_CHLRE|nr:uncharacterized protein CHLRE_07g325650v5 [Chlamydomonas reinhardtii]PNW80629.1 hypothetical protein CHLRE_07g325650v5 [Chlamydomonas reinhardtii]|eukprot:XP_001700897.1 predicted protein [Chlamydomonas reinhardtii]
MGQGDAPPAAAAAMHSYAQTLPGPSQPSYGAYPPGAYPQGYPGYPPPAPPGSYAPAQGPYAPPGPPYGPSGYLYPAPGQPVMAAHVPYPPGTMMMVAVTAPAGPVSLPSYWPPYPIEVTCPGCREKVQSVAIRAPGLGTWLIAGGICLVGCGFGCCLIPFCVDSCKDCTHSCPKCNRFLGQHKMV